MTDAKQTVLNFLKALNDEDFDAARKLLSDDMSFVGVMGTRDGGDAYIQDMQKMKFKYNVQKALADGNDVSVWYTINMSGPMILSSGLYEVTDGRIKSLNVLFDPRPLLNK